MDQTETSVSAISEPLLNFKVPQNFLFFEYFDGLMIINLYIQCVLISPSHSF